MPVDIALATTIVTSFLLPYAKIGIEKLSEGLGEKLGEIGAEQGTGALKKVWERVKSKFQGKDDQPIWTQFEKHPEAAQGLVQAMLQEKLAQDPALAQELSDLINAPLPGRTSTGAQITNADMATILDLRRAIALQPENGANYWLRGRAYYELADYPAAVADLGRAIELQPEEGINYHWRGTMYYEMADYPAAVADLSRAIELQPEEGGNYYWRGLAHHKLEDYPAAGADLVWALELQMEAGDGELIETFKQGCDVG